MSIYVAVGLGEVAFAGVLLAAWRARWLLLATAVVMVGALGGVALSSPGVLPAAVNPVTLNLSVAALAVIGWLAARDLPSAAHCRREPGGEV